MAALILTDRLAEAEKNGADKTVPDDAELAAFINSLAARLEKLA